VQRIVFLNRFFPPDHSATSQLLGDVAGHLAACGQEVHVITSRQIYDDPQARLPAEETLDGVHVHRVATTQFGRSKLIGRAFDYFSFYASAGPALSSLTRPGDVVVAMTDPPLISLVATQVATRRHAYLVNWLQDIYPEVAAQLGLPFLKGPLLPSIINLRDRTLKKAAANIVVGEQMADKLASRGIAKNRIQVITNWTEDEEILPVTPELNPLRQTWQLADKFVVGYSGNLGRAHEFDTILAAAERLSNNSNIVFVCIGGGHMLDRLAQKVKDRGLRNFKFFGYQDRTVLRYSLSVPDVHWVSLNPKLEGLIVPSKIYGIAAAGRPVIAVCARHGEIAKMVEQYACGRVVEPGDVDALVELIVQLYGDRALCAEMGRNARTMLDAHFTRQQSLARWRQLFEDLQNLQKGAGSQAGL
jgi:colanic acid biosynthesis glycosyl transferase WcaI